MFIVELEPGMWLANWDGDPGRTLEANHAKRFPTQEEALLALQNARAFREFPRAVILYREQERTSAPAILESLSAALCQMRPRERITFWREGEQLLFEVEGGWGAEHQTTFRGELLCHHRPLIFGVPDAVSEAVERGFATVRGR